MKKIYVFGDSFAAYSYYCFKKKFTVKQIDPDMEPEVEIKQRKSWIDYLSELLDAEICNVGITGTNVHHLTNNAYDVIKQGIDPEDILIFAWTNPDRPVDAKGDLLLKQNIIDDGAILDGIKGLYGNKTNAYIQATNYYWVYLHNDNEFIKSYRSCQIAVNELTKHFKHVYHLNNFDSVPQFEHNKWVFEHDLVNWSLTFDDFDWSDFGNYPNHLSDKGNKELATILAKQIHNDQS